jgi:hypothetical protein
LTLSENSVANKLKVTRNISEFKVEDNQSKTV